MLFKAIIIAKGRIENYKHQEWKLLIFDCFNFRYIGVVFSIHFSKQYYTQPKSGFFHWSKSGKSKSFKDEKPYPDFQSRKIKSFKDKKPYPDFQFFICTLPFSLIIAVLDIEKQLTFIYSSDFKTVSSTFVFTLVTSCFLKQKKCLLINLW